MRVAAGRPAERVQHPRGGRDGDSAGCPGRRHRARPRQRSTACPDGFSWCRDARDDITVVVDYAHTDDALKNLLETARPLAQRRVITVFGCGGDRDRTKRPLMGAVAVAAERRRRDHVRQPAQRRSRAHHRGDQARRSSAAPDRAGAFFAIVDRKEAIEYAIKMAEPGDLVLLAGKGHEKTQVIGSQELPFDEAAIARAALERRR